VEFVLQARLERARQLLATPGQKVADTAARCGFSSTRTLTRPFLRYEGVSALSWKKANKQPRRPV